MDNASKIEKQRALFGEWSDILLAHELPSWDEFPEIELYMDQVVILTTKYLAHLGSLLDEDKPVTPAMINNYVKMGLLPAPTKKRYNKDHLACLIMVCILKRSLSMSVIQKLIPVGKNSEEVGATYEAFRLNRKRSVEYVAQQVSNWGDEIFQSVGNDENNSLVIRLAVMASLFKLSAEKISDSDI